MAGTHDNQRPVASVDRFIDIASVVVGLLIIVALGSVHRLAALLGVAVFILGFRPEPKVFSTVFDVAVPAALMAAIIAFLGMAFDSPLAVLTGVGVFVLGLIPAAKMKRADIVSEMQKRFAELAGDRDALIGEWKDSSSAGAASPGTPPTVVPGIPAQHAPSPLTLTNEQKVEKAADAFYLRFWNLQLLQFGLWRYAMIPSDTYAHWMVRRLLSFSREDKEEYWKRSPALGWEKASSEFVGTDFSYFIEMARDIRKENPKSDAELGYPQLHLRIERLLVAVSGGGLRSTFILRWFNAKRPSLEGKHDRLVKKSMAPLLRERRCARALFLLMAVALMAPALIGGRMVHAYVKQFSDRPRAALVIGAGGGGVVLDPERGPAPVFVVGFNEEGACEGRSDPRTWRGARLSSASVAFVERIARGLAACHKDRPVRVDVVGYASSSQFKQPLACGPNIKTADEANEALAKARAENVQAVLKRQAPDVEVTIPSWPDAYAMSDERAIRDRASADVYSEPRGSLNRRVEIRVISAGDCGIP